MQTCVSFVVASYWLLSIPLDCACCDRAWGICRTRRACACRVSSNRDQLSATCFAATLILIMDSAGSSHNTITPQRWCQYPRPAATRCSILGSSRRSTPARATRSARSSRNRRIPRRTPGRSSWKEQFAETYNLAISLPLSSSF